jgi:hypothetical protein
MGCNKKFFLARENTAIYRNLNSLASWPMFWHTDATIGEYKNNEKAG